MTVLLGRVLNGAAWAIAVATRGNGGPNHGPAPGAAQSAVLAATL